MKRDWVTLAFGMALVGAVVGLSLRQNITQAPAGVSRGTESGALAAPAPAADAVPASPAGAAVPGAVPGDGPLVGRAGQPASPSPVDRARSPQATAAAPPASGTALRVAPTAPLQVAPAGVPAGVTTPMPAASPVAPTTPPVRLNAMIPVVHRHAMGSCQGMLVATSKGLTYDTAHKDDAFAVAFADMDQFDVDYLKKNLRVRRRAGRTWNFTNDSADALFIFHRDVAKTRERLAAR